MVVQQPPGCWLLQRNKNSPAHIVLYNGLGLQVALLRLWHICRYCRTETQVEEVAGELDVIFAVQFFDHGVGPQKVWLAFQIAPCLGMNAEVVVKDRENS